MRLSLILLTCAITSCGEAHRRDPCALDAEGAPWVAFASYRTGDYEIWRVRADGTCLAQVTHTPGPDLYPTWYGGAIVFGTERGGIQRLWAHDLATGIETQVDTGELVAATSPAFSPDGSSIAFEGRAADATSSSIYVVPAGGGTATRLEATPGLGAGPAWAPDGVYFVSQRSGSYEVWTSLPGGDARRVTTGSRIVGKPAVAADGAALVYARTVAGSSTTEVVRQDRSTGDVTLVSSLDDSEPSVSGDGQRVVVRSFRAGHADVLVEGLDGSGVVSLTSDAASDGSPAFALPR